MDAVPAVVQLMGRLSLHDRPSEGIHVLNAVAGPLAALLVCVTLAPCVTASAAQSARSSQSSRIGQTWTGRVVAVADGDSLEVMREGRAVRVRLAAIDAPEHGQPWSRRAKSRLAELTMQRTVSILVRDVDRYDRDVVDIRDANGRRVNDILVAEGLAWFYASYSNDNGLRQLQTEARSAGRGLWTEKNPTPPWTWRQRHARRSR